MRWLFLLLTLACGGMAFNTNSPGLMGLLLLLMMLFGFLAVLAFAHARIEAGSQSQASMIGARDVQVLRQQSLQKKVMQNKAQQQGTIGASGAGYSSYGGPRTAQDGGDGGSDGGGSDGGGGSD